MSDINVQINNPTVAVTHNDNINVSQDVRPISAEITEITYAVEVTDTTIAVTLSPTTINVTTNAQGPAWVPGLVWLGAYNAGVTYAVGEAVYYNGSSYICILASTGNLPTNATYWDTLALKGDDGDPGQGVPAGGALNYILAKASVADFDTNWVPMPEGFSGEYGDLTGTPDLSVYVPYTGATGDVNIGVHSLIAHALQGDASDGVYIKASNGTNVGLLGVANTANVTWYGAHIFSTMTQGSVLFTGSNGLLSQDNLWMYYNDTENRLSLFTTLGNEILTNPNFTGAATGWTVPSGMTYSSNAVSKTGNGTGALVQNVTIYVLREYLLTYTISNWTVGSVTPSVGGFTGTAVSANGTYTERFVAASSAQLAFTPTNTARFTIDSVSLKPLKGTNTKSNFNVWGLSIEGEWSNGSPGTTRAMTFNNDGTYSWTDYRFAGVLRAATGASSSGEYSVHTSGGNYFGLYWGSSWLASTTLYCYIYPTALVHSSGHISAQAGMHAGLSATSTPPSKMTVHGRMGLKPTYLYTNTTLDDTYSVIYANGDLNNICTGTPTYACSHWTNETDCHLRDFHGGTCAWFAGSDCSVYNNESGMGQCSGTSGCTVETSSCTGGDQMSCESNDDAYGGNCAWTEWFADCSAYNWDESGCGSTSGCTQNYGDCTPYGDAGGDWSACTGYNASCSYDSMTGSCTGTPFLSCSGTYSTGFTCTGNYNTGNCTGTFWAACSWTSTCTGVDYADCLSEDGCSQSSWLSLLFPTEGAHSTGFYAGYEVINVGATANVTMLPNTGQTANGTTSIVIGPNRKARIIKFGWVQNDCQAFSGTSSGTCTTGHTGCTWTSCSGLDEATCTSEGGDCSWDGVSCVGTGNCSWTWGVRDWGITGGVF